MKLSVVGLRITGVVIFISSLQGVNSMSSGDNNTFGTVMSACGSPAVQMKKGQVSPASSNSEVFRSRSF